MLKLNDEFTLDGETWRLVSMNMAADHRPLEIIAVPARPIKPAGQIPPRSSDRPAPAPPVTTSKPAPQDGTRFAPSEAPFMKLAREAMEQKAERDRIVAAFEEFDSRCTAMAPCGHCMAWLVANQRPWVGRVIESGPPAYRQLWVVAEDGTEVAPGLLEFQ